MKQNSLQWKCGWWCLRLFTCGTILTGITTERVKSAVDSFLFPIFRFYSFWKHCFKIYCTTLFDFTWRFPKCVLSLTRRYICFIFSKFYCITGPSVEKPLLSPVMFVLYHKASSIPHENKISSFVKLFFSFKSPLLLVILF